MSVLHTLFSRNKGNEPVSSDDLKAAVTRWNKHGQPDLQQPHFHTRYAVFGFAPEPEAEKGLSFAVLGVEEGRVWAGDACTLDVTPESPEPAHRLMGLLGFLEKTVWVGFRTDFGITSIRRLLDEHSGVEIAPEVLDLAVLLPELYPDGQSVCKSLSDWLRFLDQDDLRDDAVADAFAVARLLQCVLLRAGERGLISPADLQRAEKARRWLWSH